MGNEHGTNTNDVADSIYSTQIKPPGFNNRERSLSKSKSKSKSKTKTKTKTFSSKSTTMQLPDISTSIPNNGSVIYSTTTSSLFSHHLTKPKKRRKSKCQSVDLKNIKNGITGTYISPRIVKIAAEFWEEHISCKSLEDKLEFGCAIYFGMMVHNSEMKRVFRKNINMANSTSIEKSSIKFLDMMGWLLRSLLRSDTDVFKLLQNLGEMHKKMGVEYKHFDPMLQSMHETFSYYFPIKYRIQIKYALDQIFAISTRIMTGTHLREDHNYNHLEEIQDSMHKHEFLENLTACLASNVGREYLYRYLQQTFCDEIAIFLQSLAKFKTSPSDKERFMVARSIVKNSIEPSAMFAVNISYDNRSQCIANMVELERIFFEKDDLTVSKDMFKVVEKELHKLIMDNHWRRFNNTFKNIEQSPNSPN